MPWYWYYTIQEEHKAELAKKELQRTYETNVLTYRSYEDQVKKYMQDSKINLDYCKNEANIQQFRTK